MANLAADLVFLLIELLLLGACDVTVIGLRHRALFLTNCMVLGVELLGLAFRYFAFADFLVNAAILILQAAVDFGTARMFAVPLRLSQRAPAAAAADRLISSLSDSNFRSRSRSARPRKRRRRCGFTRLGDAGPRGTCPAAVWGRTAVFQKKTSVRISMLSRSRALGAAVGSWKAV
jgi:hypothetical protein